MKQGHLKTRKWYKAGIVPDRNTDLIVMTDMGYVFEAVYEDGMFLISNMRNYKVYFEPTFSQESIVRWMKY